MFFLRPALLICGVALFLALAADIAFMVLSRIYGGFGVIAKPTGWLLLTTLWLAASVAIAYRLARVFHIFPWVSR